MTGGTGVEGSSGRLDGVLGGVWLGGSGVGEADGGWLPADAPGLALPGVEGRGVFGLAGVGEGVDGATDAVDAASSSTVGPGSVNWPTGVPLSAAFM